MDEKTKQIFKELLDEKDALIKKIKEQMGPDVTAGVLKAETTNKFVRAEEALQNAQARLESPDEKLQSEIPYFFGRISWNLGEFMAMSRQNRADAK